MADNVYTHKEKTEKKYSVYDALAQAKAVLEGKPVCTTSLNKYGPEEKLTLAELSDLVEQLVSDTRFYG